MEIITLLRANIRKKKGAFISIFLLTAIVTTVAMAIFGVRDNYEKGMANAFEAADCGDTVIIMKEDTLTEEIRGRLEQSALVDRVEQYDALVANGAQFGQITDGNSYYMETLRKGIRLYNSEQNGFEEEIPSLQKGEIYLPLGLKSKLSCDVGDVITVSMIFRIKEDFTIKGFVEEPAFGSMMIGWKQVFICEEDFKSLYEKCRPLQTENITLRATAVYVYQAEDSKLSPLRFQRELNLETGIVDISFGALNREQSERYSTIMTDIIMDIIMVFVAFLFIIVLIVMEHSIGTEIEIDYVTLGIMKAQGFGSKKIRLLFFLQYMLAEIAGMAIGAVAAIPIERALSAACRSVTGVLPALGLSAGKSVLYSLIILVCSVLIIMIKTHKIAKISPVRAISGGREQIYFDSRLNAPIAKKTLSVSLAFRQFTSNKKQYAGIMLIAAILTFFMITIDLVGELLGSRKALEAMGMKPVDIEIYLRREEGLEHMPAIDELVRAGCEIEETNREYTTYVSINGENLYCEIFEDTEVISGILKGREPIYDNEIIVTEMICKALDLKMGDKVRVSSSDREIECIISGIFQGAGDSGMGFATNFETAKRLDIKVDFAMRYYIIKDKSLAAGIADEITEKYGEFVTVYTYDSDSNPVEQQYGEIVDLLKIIIYTFSLLFAFVAIRMSCSKSFIWERRDIGIYKAVGFTSRRLRFGFAVRFLLVSLIGAIIGTVSAFFFSARAVGASLRLIGISRVKLEFTTQSLLIPIFAIALSYFVFAYMASRRIRSVEVRELVSE